MGRKPIWSGLIKHVVRKRFASRDQREAEPIPSIQDREGDVPETPKHSKLVFSPQRLLCTIAFLVFQLFAANAVWSATHVQQASNSNVGGAAVASISVTFNLPTTTGNAIILGITYGNLNPTISATDSQGNKYLLAINTYDSGHRQGSAILYATNIIGGTHNTVTVTFNSLVAYLAVGVHEYSGIVASAALDVAIGRLGTGSAPSSGSATTTASGDLIFGCGVDDGSGQGDTFIAGSGFTKRVDLGNTAAYSDEDGAQTQAGPIAATWTLSPANSWIATLTAFKSTTGSPNTTPPPPTSAPTIAGLSPSTGPVGSHVTITGTNFGRRQVTSTVSFSGISATTTSWSSTAVVATVPNGATTGNVNITVNAITSNNVLFSLPQVAISLAVSPASTAVQVGHSQLFTASLQNDTQNKGVSWSLTGSGCSGPACGTLSNASATSVTYTAPLSLPSPAAVTLQAMSVADTTKSASSTISVVGAPAISASVSPSSSSVQVASSTNFTASILNDSQNAGVSWTLAGAGCSGISCGSLTNETLSSVTYTAPENIPSAPLVTLTATSIADNTKTANASITVTQLTQSNGVPTFAENHVSGSSTQGNSVSSYILRLPNPSLAGNCIIVGFQYSATPGVTPSVADDKGNTYSSAAQTTDGRQVVNIWYSLNVAPGAQKITVTFSGTSPSYVSALASEFYNVAPSNALDSSSGGSGSGSSVSAGSLTPTASGDLIYQYAVQDSTSSSPMAAWTQGANPWLLLSADLLDGAAAQYQVQSAAAPITPTFAMAPAQGFTSVAVALRSSNAGTPPPPGIRVVRVQNNSIQPYASSPVQLQFPSTGNLLVVSWIGVPDHDLTGVTDNNKNTYVSTGPAFGYGLSGENQIYYAATAITGTTLTGPNLSTVGTDISGSTAVLLDVRGAATAPYDSTAGRATASATQSTAGSVTGVTLSPTTTNGLVISSIGVDSNTIVGVSPGIFLSIVPSPVISPNSVQQNNGWALFYNASAGPETFVWASQGGPVYNWASIAVAFMAAPN
jgi:IPT/TIG domain